MLFLKLGDYEGVMTMLDRAEDIEEDRRLFMRMLVSSDPKSPYFNAQDVRVYMDTLANLYPDSPYTIQASVVADLMDKYAESAAEAERLGIRMTEINSSFAEIEAESAFLNESADEFRMKNSELRRENERLAAQEKRLKSQLTEINARLEAIKEIDLRIKQSQEGNGRE
jgi:predicted nuclease with TOPRIM domain